jgi:hypothetical protein
MNNNNFNCDACNYSGATKYYYNRHVQSEKHKKIMELKQARIVVYDNLYVCDMNKKSFSLLNKLNNNKFRDYNIWLNKNLCDENIKILDVINFAGPNGGDELINSPSVQNNDKAITCPWCSEFNTVKNLAVNNLVMSLEDCFEHMKTCPHIHDHTNIEKHKSVILNQALKMISDMVDNFKILSSNYELLKEQNEELIKTSNKFNKLKTKYDFLKETNNAMLKENSAMLKENQTKYYELAKESISNNSKSNEKKVNLTINGNVNNVNLLTYISDNCKEAEPINAIDNSRKIAMNQLLLTKGINKILNQQANDTLVASPKISEMIVPSQTHTTATTITTPTTTIECPEITLPKMFIEGYNDNKNSYHVFIADILTKYFKKDDITKQPLWSTDTSRCSYIIKILPDDWVKDKSGITLLDTCIKPFIDYIDSVIRKYSESLDGIEEKIQEEFMKETKQAYIKKFKGKYLDKFDFTCIDSCLICNEELYNFSANKSLGIKIKDISFQKITLAEIILCINKEGFAKKVIKEITPYFASDRLKLNSVSNITEIPVCDQKLSKPKELTQSSDSLVTCTK